VPKRDFSPELLHTIAQRFKALGEPTRLQILNALRDSEATVTDLGARTGLSQANLSKQLNLLLQLGFVARRKEGLFAWYRIADRDVFRLCDLICDRLEREDQARRKLLRR